MMSLRGKSKTHARDSKSRPRKRGCGFDPLLRHELSPVLTQNNPLARAIHRGQGICAKTYGIPEFGPERPVDRFKGGRSFCAMMGHRNGDMSLLVPFVDISVSFDNLFEWIRSIHDRF